MRRSIPSRVQPRSTTWGVTWCVCSWRSIARACTRPGPGTSNGSHAHTETSTALSNTSRFPVWRRTTRRCVTSRPSSGSGRGTCRPGTRRPRNTKTPHTPHRHRHRRRHLRHPQPHPGSPAQKPPSLELCLARMVPRRRREARPPEPPRTPHSPTMCVLVAPSPPCPTSQLPHLCPQKLAAHRFPHTRSFSQCPKLAVVLT
mmetsp:Transcript_15523/g.37005  ORF Transcript_15523/g.37005 Transcript_15523/m.37005 type:complete len:201 (-) Transcript_15523:893-1495(-)